MFDMRGGQVHLYPFLLEQTPQITANRVIRAMYPETYSMRGVPRRSDCGTYNEVEIHGTCTLGDRGEGEVCLYFSEGPPLAHTIHGSELERKSRVDRDRLHWKLSF